MFEDSNKMNKYKEMMDDQDISYDEIQLYLKKQAKNYLYRYRSPSYMESEIFEGLVKLTTGDAYNDPFECGFYIDEKELYRNSDPLMKEILDIASPMIKQTSFFSSAPIKAQIEEHQKRYFLACFSESKDNILMWSHYAQDHKGICIRYDYEKIPYSIIKHIFPIIYSKTKFNATSYYTKFCKNTFSNESFYKLDVWSYEQEWRFSIDIDKIYEVIDNGQLKKQGEFTFLRIPECISAIYFGARFNFLDDSFLQCYEQLYKVSKERQIKFYKIEVPLNESVKLKEVEIIDLKEYIEKLKGN